MWPIVREALRDASPDIRSQARVIVVFWLCVVALQVWDSRDGRGAAGVAEFMSAILGASGVTLLGIAYTLQRTMHDAAQRKRPDGEAAAVQRVLLALPALGFAAGVMLGAAALLMVLRGLLGWELPFAVIGAVVYGSFVLMAARTVMRSVQTLFEHATRQAAAAAQARSEAAAAQVAALQSQMNPHFLFNALNTVASLVRSDPRRAERVVEDLAEVLRRTLDRSATTAGTVRDEVEYVRAYLALEQERWGDRLRVEWNVDPDALEHPLPPLMLQPLVENALRHGLAARLDGTVLRITIEIGDSLTLSVDDDGPGFVRGWHEGTGLGSVRQRLASLYGDAAALRVVEGTPGARVSVVVPRHAEPLMSAR
jgi:signal transduction histidine kinase